MLSIYPDNVPQGIYFPGNYPVKIDGNLGLGGGDVNYFTSTSGEPPAAVTLQLLEYVPGRSLRGALIGSVRVTGPAPGFVERTEPLNASFDIFIPPDYVKPVPGPFGTLFRCTIAGGDRQW